MKDWSVHVMEGEVQVLYKRELEKESTRMLENSTIRENIRSSGGNVSL